MHLHSRIMSTILAMVMVLNLIMSLDVTVNAETVTKEYKAAEYTVSYTVDGKKADLEDYFSNEKVKEITHYDTVFQSEKCYGYCYSEYNGSDNGVTYIFEIRSPDNVSFLFSVECDGDAIYVYDNHYTTMYRDRRD